MDEQSTIFVGIDVSEDRLDVHLMPLDDAFHVLRDGKGLETLARRLSSLPVTLVVLGATGGFEASVAAALAAARLPLCILNPRHYTAESNSGDPWPIDTVPLRVYAWNPRLSRHVLFPCWICARGHQAKFQILFIEN